MKRISSLFLAAMLCTSGLIATSVEPAEAKKHWRNNRGNHYGWRNRRSSWERRNNWRNNDWNRYHSGWNWNNNWNNNWYDYRNPYRWY